MAILNPCCCCSLQAGTKTVAMINIVLSIIAFIGLLIPVINAVGFVAAAMSSDLNSSSQTTQELSRSRIIVTVFEILALLFCFVYLMLSIVLYNGANQRNYTKCRIWMIISIMLLIFFVIDSARILYFAYTTRKTVSYDSFLLAFARIFLGIFISMYQIWVVSAFLEELRIEKHGHSFACVGHHPVIHDSQKNAV